MILILVMNFLRETGQSQRRKGPEQEKKKNIQDFRGFCQNAVFLEKDQRREKTLISVLPSLKKMAPPGPL